MPGAGEAEDPEGADALARLRADLAAQSSVANVLAEAPTLEEAAPRLLAAIGAGLEWELGSLWVVDERDQVLRWRAGWSAGDGAPAFERESARRPFAPGEGLPGRVWARAARIPSPTCSRTPTSRAPKRLRPTGSAARSRSRSATASASSA